MKLEEITSRIDPEEGWNDVFLKITDQTRTPSSVTYTARGLYEGQIVGIAVEVQTNMPPDFYLPEKSTKMLFIEME